MYVLSQTVGIGRKLDIRVHAVETLRRNRTQIAARGHGVGSGPDSVDAASHVHILLSLIKPEANSTTC